jgi:release factor glutamine methyltransferase
MTIREAITQGSVELKATGIENSYLDASLLLAHILNISRTALIAAGPEPLSQAAFTSFRSLIDRRINGECTAYILEKKEFRGLEFLVTPQVLVPRPDTETLVETALSELGIKEGGLYVLDLCTGSGAVAIAIKHEMPKLEVWAADISDEALTIAKTNAARLLPGDNSIHFFSGDLYTTALLASGRLFSLIVCNPPYIPSGTIKKLSAEVQKEPLLALDGGPSGLEIIKRAIEGAPSYLMPGGTLLMEADPQQMKDIGVLLQENGFGRIKTYYDLSGRERVIGGTYE